jgi:hypothetical protein
MKQTVEIITITVRNVEIITTKQFALDVAKNGIPVGKTFWCSYGSTDAIKCILLSHGHNLKRLETSAENKYQQFMVQ